MTFKENADRSCHVRCNVILPTSSVNRLCRDCPRSFIIDKFMQVSRAARLSTVHKPILLLSRPLPPFHSGPSLALSRRLYTTKDGSAQEKDEADLSLKSPKEIAQFLYGEMRTLGLGARVLPQTDDLS